MKGMLGMFLAGSLAANFGLTGLDSEDSANQQQQVSSAFEHMVPRAQDIGDLVPNSMNMTVRSEIEGEVNAGVRQLDRSVREVPIYAVKVAQQVEKHGIAALAYTDPVLQEQGRALGTEIGQGIRHFAVALGKDLVLAAHDSGVRVR